MEGSRIESSKSGPFVHEGKGDRAEGVNLGVKMRRRERSHSGTHSWRECELIAPVTWDLRVKHKTIFGSISEA